MIHGVTINFFSYRRRSRVPILVEKGKELHMSLRFPTLLLWKSQKGFQQQIEEPYSITSLNKEQTILYSNSSEDNTETLYQDKGIRYSLKLFVVNKVESA